MAVAQDRHAYAELSTSTVPVGEAFAYWREMICATFVKLSADPVPGAQFRGQIEHTAVGDLEMSRVAAGSQHVRRTASLITHSQEEFLLASIQLRGEGRVEQDGRSAVLQVGDMAFYDSTRPYTLHFDDPFEQLVVQVPRGELPFRDTRTLTARTLGSTGPGVVVPGFFTSLAGAAKASPVESAVLIPQAVGLLGAAASMVARVEPDAEMVRSLVRAHAVEFLCLNLDNPHLDAEAVAVSIHVSRRTLYRAFGGEGDGIAGQLRRMRIERSKAILVTQQHWTVAAVASACGFDSESGFHRAFRAATGMTPGEYRDLRQIGTPGL
ncbi:MAG: helix-turn-helix domain-containing protein [Haloechinothrix sp.]